MISRDQHILRIESLLKRNRVVAILGARQVGKTTIAKQILARRSGDRSHFDLEDPRDRGRLGDPMLSLGHLRGLVVLDEVQRVPELFQILRVLADKPRGARFLVLGSASPELLRQTSESLAGRIAYYELGGFDIHEIGAARVQRLWLRGGFPRSFTAGTEKNSVEWRNDFIKTFFERELPTLGMGLPPELLRRFWFMLAHYHGQIWNSTEFAASLGVADKTISRYLDLLVGTFLARRISPWFENLQKRQVKAPKIYISDTGLLHSLLGIEDMADLERNVKLGASWESFGFSNVLDHLRPRSGEVYYWATHQGAELDLLIVRGRRRLGFEIKRSSAPQLTPSMRIALADLKLDSIDVIYPGEHTYPMAPRIRAVPLHRIRETIDSL